MKFSIVSTATLSLLLVAQSLSAQEVKPKPAGDAAPMMTMDHTTFVKVVSSANEFEIRSSELAREKATDEDIKKIADMIIADHKKAGERLKAILEAKKAAPSEPVQLAPKQQKMLDQLQSASGKDFDTLYIDMQAQAHMEAIATFRTFTGSGDDQTLVGFARETLPALETHMAHVKMLVEKM